MSEDVTLPIRTNPSWPAECVRCGHETPDGEFSLAVKRETWLYFAKSGRTVQIPACADCSVKLRRGLVARYVSMAALVMLGVTGGVVYLLITPDPSRFVRRWAVPLGFLSGAAPAVLYWVFRPPPIDAMVEGERIKYEFRSKRYADEFRRLNPL